MKKAPPGLSNRLATPKKPGEIGHPAEHADRHCYQIKIVIVALIDVVNVSAYKLTIDAPGGCQFARLTNKLF